MLKKLVTLSVVLSGASLLAGLEPIIDWDGFEKDGSTVASYVLQSAINEKSPLENCLVSAESAVKQSQEKGYQLARIECVPAGFKGFDGKLDGYKVIIYKAE